MPHPGSQDLLQDMPPDGGGVLLAIARAALCRHFGRATDIAPAEGAWLGGPAATFVTLEKGGDLRGCVGTLEARRSLRDDVAANALAAALHDSRFPPLEVHELDATCIEVSLLSRPVPLAFSSENEALALLRPGVDGVILSAGSLRGTYLPQVWEHLAEPALFLASLKRKAGLPAGYWSRDVRLSTYQVRHWKEASP